MKNAQRQTFKLHLIAAFFSLCSILAAGIAHAGSGWGASALIPPTPIQSFYANSPSGASPILDATGAPQQDPVTKLPVLVDTGTALRKFVDTLPGLGPLNANNLGQYIPIAVPEKNWFNPATGLATADDYYEIAAVEYTEKMHSDLVKPTRLRGYVQLSTPNNPGKHIALTYPNGSQVLDALGAQVYACDYPHHLGPVIQSTRGTAVRIKFTNYLPAGGELFLPVDTSLPGAGLSADGINSYTQNRANLHLFGGQLPWISAGSPHQWIAPAAETAAYAAGLGRGVSAMNVPDMADPGPGSNTLYFPNAQSARFMFYQDHTSGLTRLNVYAGLEAGYFITDPAEQGLITSGAIPADQIPLILEDKTFVPANIAQQDAKWDTLHWGQPGDLWFPHVYETNQDPTAANGANPVGRWDYGPWFWPIFTATQPLPSGAWGNASFTPEAYQDTPLVNGTAYPVLTVDPRAYRFRILNASNDRYFNLGLYKADATFKAPQLDLNGNAMVDALGNPLFFTNTEVKMVPAAADVNGNPLIPSYTDLVCLCQYPALPQLQPAITFSGPNRAWPSDGRISGAPDPAAVGPDFIAIGNDGGLLPNPVDIPSQPITYEQNRRSITVTNIYGYGLLLGPAERADVIVDFSKYAGQTLILYNDAPAPTPFNDQRVDYYTGNPDLTGSGGAYSTHPGYGPNTRTVMQIKVNAAPVAATGTFNANTLLTALPAAYAATQAAPIVPESTYNTAFKTNDTDNYAHVATGSVAQPNLSFTSSGTLTITGVQLISSGGVIAAGGVGNATPGSGSGYLSAPIVNFNNGACLPAGVPSAAATATVDPVSHQVIAVNLVNPLGYSGYTCAPTITFTPTTVSGGVASIGLSSGGTGYSAPVVNITGGGGTGATATASITSPIASTVTLSSGGSQYSAPVVSFTGGGGTGAAATATVGNSPVTGITIVNGGQGYLAPLVSIAGGGGTGAAATATVGTSPITAISVLNGGTGYLAPTVTLSGGGGTGATATATVGTSSLAGITLSAGGARYKTPTVNIIPVDGNGSGAAASATIDAAGSVTGITVTNPGAGYTATPTITITDGALRHSGPTTARAVATLTPGAGSISAITFTPGSGYTSPPTVTITDATGTGAVASAALAAGAGSITGISFTGGTGYIAPPTVTITDATGTGASATASLLPAAGVITGITVSNPGSGYTQAPSITISDATGTGAVASVPLAFGPGAVTGIVVTSPGSGYTSVPSVIITDATGTGATAAATLSGTSGSGAQASVVTNNTQSIPVRTKAEQELFDASGRYNSTGGVELPFTSATTQTTIPLSYIDSPTEIIGDGETQIWKIVDNGFWSNSVHFDFVEVQVINRVGWDGTVKPPASNEVGWKDTVRLNPLEDLIVAMRAVRPAIPFGLPQSVRAQDPSVALGAAGSNLGFLASPGVTTLPGDTPPNAPLLTTTVNVAANYDNEFVWNSAILGHSEDDFMRPIVYTPLVTLPDAPSNLTLNAGTLSWTDPTPAALASTIANPMNEIGFIIQRSIDGAPYVEAARVPANATSWVDGNILPATSYAYYVTAYNAMGNSLASNTVTIAPPAPAAPGNVTAFAGRPGSRTITVSWTASPANAAGYTIQSCTMDPTLTVCGPWSTVGTVSANLTTLAITRLIRGITYSYQVMANGAGGNNSAYTGPTAPVAVP